MTPRRTSKRKFTRLDPPRTPCCTNRSREPHQLDNATVKVSQRHASPTQQRKLWASDSAVAQVHERSQFHVEKLGTQRETGSHAGSELTAVATKVIVMIDVSGNKELVVPKVQLMHTRWKLLRHTKCTKTRARNAPLRYAQERTNETKEEPVQKGDMRTSENSALAEEDLPRRCRFSAPSRKDHQTNSRCCKADLPSQYLAVLFFTLMATHCEQEVYQDASAQKGKQKQRHL